MSREIDLGDVVRWTEDGRRYAVVAVSEDLNADEPRRRVTLARNGITWGPVPATSVEPESDAATKLEERVEELRLQCDDLTEQLEAAKKRIVELLDDSMRELHRAETAERQSTVARASVQCLAALWLEEVRR